jgi:NAD-dependent SIR2 family protein deacetylase
VANAALVGRICYRSSVKVFVLTGAGVSAEGGLGTFRNNEKAGLWARFDPILAASAQCEIRR